MRTWNMGNGTWGMGHGAWAQGSTPCSITCFFPHLLGCPNLLKEDSERPPSMLRMQSDGNPNSLPSFQCQSGKI